MPIIANAKKALRQQKTRTERNRVTRAKMRGVIKKAESDTTPVTMSSLFSSLDRAVKKHLIHKNKAARIKSRITKQAGTSSDTQKQVVKAATKKSSTAKKKAAKKPTSKKK